MKTTPALFALLAACCALHVSAQTSTNATPYERSQAQYSAGLDATRWQRWNRSGPTTPSKKKQAEQKQQAINAAIAARSVIVATDKAPGNLNIYTTSARIETDPNIRREISRIRGETKKIYSNPDGSVRTPSTGERSQAEQNNSMMRSLGSSSVNEDGSDGQ